MDIKFGQSITIKSKLIRCYEHHNDGYRSKTYKCWKPRLLPNIKTGIFLGYRTLSNGYRSYFSDEGYSFAPMEYFKCALVCISPTHNPIYVPLDDII